MNEQQPPIVVKYGGHAMADDALRAAFAEDVAALRATGWQVVVVHGGGPQIEAHLDRLGIESTFTAGLRVTSAEAVDIVRMVLTGQVGRDIVGAVNRHGPLAVGMSGEDANLFTATRRQAMVDGEAVDIGQVGEIVAVDPGCLRTLLDDGRVPVISSIARGGDGEIYNVNADLAASALAAALGADRLIMLTDVPGLYADWPDQTEIVAELTAGEAERLLPGLTSGMAPKMEACLSAVRAGVAQARILDGRIPHVLADELLLGEAAGTKIVANAGEAGTIPSQREDLRTRFGAALMPTYGVPPLALVAGSGCRVWDESGREYLDLAGGIAVSSLGHAHPAMVAAVSAQVAKLAHTSNLYVNEPSVALAERLLELLGTPGRVFFCNSGTEANEAAYKLVRKHTGQARPLIVAASGSFHGRTLGSLALTGKGAIREPFGPYSADVRFVPYGDPETLADAVTEDCAAVFLEPILGEGGVVPAPAGYLSAARKACDEVGALLVLDEVQTGIGRTGTWFAWQHEGVLPDVLTLAKGLGGGLPIGACLAVDEYGETFAKGDHGSTFGGNPVAAAAALAVLDTIERSDLLAQVSVVGEDLAAVPAHPVLAGVRGRGLLRALVLNQPCGPEVEAAARSAGYLVNAIRPELVRLAPPLVLSDVEAASFTGALPGILDAATGGTR